SASTAQTKTSHDPNRSRARPWSAESGEALLAHAVHLGERAPGLGAAAAAGDGRDADRAADDVGIPPGRDTLAERQRHQLPAGHRVVALERVAVALAADAEVVEVAADDDARPGDRNPLHVAVGDREPPAGAVRRRVQRNVAAVAAPGRDQLPARRAQRRDGP